MFFTNMTFIGIDPTAGEKPIVYAAVDHELHLLALGQGELDDVLAFAAGQRQAALAVCGPKQPNLGLMKTESVRENLYPPPTPGRWENYRLADFLLRQRNLNIMPTPDDEKQCSNWMRVSFELFRRLREIGYETFPCPETDRCCMEVYPHAAFTALLEVIPFPKNTLEGRIQRQLALYLQDMEIPDPMKIFEEITRHRILKGILPLDDLFSPAELDALVAAYTAWKAASQPDYVTLIGDPEEGQIILPIPVLKNHY